MYTLVFDTTGNGIVAGLYKDTTCIGKKEKAEEFGQAEDLAVGVKNLLDSNRLEFKDISLLGVCTGPGSFTGVRAGLAFARGLALGSPELQLTGVPAFEVYANMLDEKDRAFYNAVVIETKREDFYFQLFDSRLCKIGQPEALTREEIAKRLKGHQVSFAGDGVERLLSVSLGLQIKQVELAEMMSLDALFRTTYQKYLQKNLDFPKPLYIRGADTCVK